MPSRRRSVSSSERPAVYPTPYTIQPKIAFYVTAISSTTKSYARTLTALSLRSACQVTYRCVPYVTPTRVPYIDAQTKNAGEPRVCERCWRIGCTKYTLLATSGVCIAVLGDRSILLSCLLAFASLSRRFLSLLASLSAGEECRLPRRRRAHG